MPDRSNPLIVQGDRTVLLEVDHPLYAEARDELARFAELIRSPEHVHTYRITSLSLWNAAATGLAAPRALAALDRYSKYDVPQHVRREIEEQLSRYGRIRLVKAELSDLPGRPGFVLRSAEEALVALAWNHAEVRPLLAHRIDANRLFLETGMRGPVKQAMTRIGWPVEDLGGYTDGAPLPLRLRDRTASGGEFRPRSYQTDAVDSFWAGGAAHGGSGVVCLPCGAGKTVVAITAMARAQVQTLVLTTNTIATRQWKRELLDKTTLTPEEVGEYTGDSKEIRPVTIATYQILTYRRRGSETFEHFGLFDRMNWGLVVYDEVHLLPAPVFRATAELQARRRLGLTATLVREDGKEDDVFSLIGPKKCDVPWKVLEKQGWIATATCTEIRVDMEGDKKLAYALSPEKDQFRIASENPAKLAIVQALLALHADELVLIIGQYLDQLVLLAHDLRVPLITGATPTKERERLYADFREGRLRVLVVSKVANFAVDLPDASVLIQISGTFGSRQEEAQRLGRVLRPKGDRRQASFYTLVSRDTSEQEFANKRQLFLTEQGYNYRIHTADELLARAMTKIPNPKAQIPTA